MLLTDDVLERLFAKIDRTSDGCHEWTGDVNKQGYGRISINRKKYSAHRLVLEIKQPGFLESGLFACHACDNPGCCNPDHLWAGTRSENTLDMFRKGRGLSTKIATSKAITGHQWTRGSKSGKAKLTEAKVLEIVDLLNKGTPTKEIATTYKVSNSNIISIKTGRSWSWLTRIDKPTGSNV